MQRDIRAFCLWLLQVGHCRVAYKYRRHYIRPYGNHCGVTVASSGERESTKCVLPILGDTSLSTLLQVGDKAKTKVVFTESEWLFCAHTFFH